MNCAISGKICRSKRPVHMSQLYCPGGSQAVDMSNDGVCLDRTRNAEDRTALYLMCSSALSSAGHVHFPVAKGIPQLSVPLSTSLATCNWINLRLRLAASVAQRRHLFFCSAAMLGSTSDRRYFRSIGPSAAALAHELERENRSNCASGG